MKAHAVIGLGFGDEGKGHVVDFLCSIVDNPVVVRFTGGHQAAHQVVMADGKRHVFAQYGSGTFRKAPTYWSHHCVMSPVSLYNEHEVLKPKCKGFAPQLIIDPHAPVTTPFELQRNVAELVQVQIHGSCGVGIFQTLERERNHVHLLFEDLYHPKALRWKMEQINDYYSGNPLGSLEAELEEFYTACEWIRNNKWIACNTADYLLTPDVTPIFEGSQGLLLDQDYGFFPNVTPSSTGTQNINNLHWRGGRVQPKLDTQVWGVTRAYQTRHGNGPMSEVDSRFNIRPNNLEMNVDECTQGKFRETYLDLDLIRYAVSKDEGFQGNRTNLVINCMDLMRDFIYSAGDRFSLYQHKEERFVEEVGKAASASGIWTSYGPTAEDIKRVK